MKNRTRSPVTGWVRTYSFPMVSLSWKNSTATSPGIIAPGPFGEYGSPRVIDACPHPANIKTTVATATNLAVNIVNRLMLNVLPRFN